ncbi:MAG TPA: hypothetical protein VE052_09515, partial [Gemmatimonadaceae bacterium]|nr:hypothetical protein [Gemmatimonadaceae bacterium]
ESQGRVVVSSVAPARVLEIAAKAGVPCTQIGKVHLHSGTLDIKLPTRSLHSPLARLRRSYRHDTEHHGTHARTRDLRRVESRGGPLRCAESSGYTVMRTRRR